MKDYLDSRDLLKELDDENLDEDRAKEIRELREDLGEIEFRDGVTLIREDYFVTYAEEWAEEIGAVSQNQRWPNNHIDWQAAADELRIDYNESEFDGTTYLWRY